MAKKIVFILGGVERSIKIFKKKPEKKFAYKLLFDVAKERGLEIYFSKVPFFEHGVFKEAVFFNGDNIEKKDVIPDAVHNRSATFSINKSDKVYEIKKHFPAINPSFFEYICDDKYMNYLLFSKFYPKTILLQKNQGIEDGLLEMFKSKRVVIKPNIGSNGKGVRVVNKEKLLPEIDNKHAAVIIQEYIESENGIPGVVEGVHDLRVTVINGKIFYTYVKIPNGSSLLCNVAQGGKMITLKDSEVPNEVLEISNEIISHFKDTKNIFYSIDFARDANGEYKLIEMNSRPGILFNKNETELQKKYYEAVADNFLRYIKQYEKK